MSNPLHDLFGISGPELVTSGEVRVGHGSIDRLPEPLRQEPFHEPGALARWYRGDIQATGGSDTSGRQVNLQGRAADLLQLGMTVIMTDVEPQLPEISEWLRDLEAEVGAPYGCSQLYAFANSAGSGLPVHHDTYDQIVIQLVGRKQFHHAANPFADRPAIPYAHGGPHHDLVPMVYGSELPSEDAVTALDWQCTVLEPGTALYLPHGTWHRTTHQEEECLSATITLRAPTNASLISQWLQRWLFQFPEWRERTYGGWSSNNTNAVERLTALVDQLAEELGSLDPSTAFSAWELHRHVANAQPYPWVRTFDYWLRQPHIHASIRPDPNHKHQIRVDLIPENRALAPRWVVSPSASSSASYG